MKRALILALSCAVAVPAAAQPAPAKTADEHYEASKKLYNIEKYDEAIAELKKAYELSPDPAYLFNIGQAMRKKNDCAGALDYYRKYLRDSPTASNKTKVEQWMTEMEACAKTQPKVVDTRPVDPKPVEIKPVVKPVETRPVDTKPVEPKPVVKPVEPKPAHKTTAMVVTDPRQVDDPVPGDRKRTLRIAGLATAGVGAGVLVFGTAMALSARGIASDISSECAVGCDWVVVEPRDDKGRQRATISKIAFGVGGAVVAGGAVMYLLGRATGKEARVAVVPADGGGLVLTGGRF